MKLRKLSVGELDVQARKGSSAKTERSRVAMCMHMLSIQLYTMVASFLNSKPSQSQ